MKLLLVLGWTMMKPQEYWKPTSQLLTKKKEHVRFHFHFLHLSPISPIIPLQSSYHQYQAWHPAPHQRKRWQSSFSHGFAIPCGSEFCVFVSEKKLSEDRSESHQILLEGDLLWFHCDFMWPFITPTWDTRSRSPGDLDAAGQETSSFLATVVPTSCPNGAALSLQDTLHGFDWICMEAFMKFSFNGFSGRFWVSFWESLDNADLGWRRTGCIPKKNPPFCWCFAFFRCFPCHHSRSRLDNQRSFTNSGLVGILQ